jgi:hypothetical protein
MPDPNLNPYEEDIMDVKKQSLYARLRTLFSSSLIVRNKGGKQIKNVDTDNLMYATDRNSLRDRFNRIRSTSYNSYSRDFALSYQAARMDLFRDYDTMDMDPILSCLASTTCVSTLTGFIPIEELTTLYPNGEMFEVWAWDKDKQKLTIGNAHHPRKTGKKHVIEIHLDNRKILKCTPDHRIMLIDGTYKEAGQLQMGEALMPFYHSFDKTHGYQQIKSLGGKYKNTHRYIFEDVFEQSVGGDNIHHINQNKVDNRTVNLQRMTAENHLKLHHIDITTRKKKSSSLKTVWKNPTYRKSALKGLRCWQNSEEGQRMMSEHSSLLNKKRWKNDPEYVLKMASIFSNHINSLWNDPEWKEWKRKKHSETMRLKYANDPTYAEKTKHCGNENGRYKEQITTESILIEGTKFDSLMDFARSFDFRGVDFKNDQYKCQFLSRRIKEAGYAGWKNYKTNFQYVNHKVVKIIDNNESTDVYDLTVDIYENFAIQDGIIVSNSALDIYSDECLTCNEMGKILTIHSPNHNVKDTLENLFTEVLNIQHNLWSWTRNMCKYGDFFLKLYITPEYGIYMVDPISAYNVERIENSDPYNKRYVKFQLRPTDTSQAEIVENYEMAHFRLMSDSNFLPYGKSVVEGARRIWKQLSLMEDAMLIHRIMRAPEKRIFYTDIGNIPPNEVDAYMQKQKDMMKKVPYMDEITGEYNLRFNLMNMVEDYFIAVRGGDSGTKIDTLGGMDWTGTEDIEYLRNKLMAALKIPKAFLGYEEGISGKATLAAEDVRFARTIQRVQRILTSELTKIAIVHLYAQGYRDESLVDFELELTNPSTIFEREKVEIWAEKVDVSMSMMESKLFSKVWIYKNVFHMSDDEIESVQNEVVEDVKQNYRFAQIEDEGNDPAKPFAKIGGLGGGGDEEGGDEEGLGDMELGDEEELPDELVSNDDGVGGGEPAGKGGAEGAIKETKTPERDQSGEHKASDHPFGEDPLGVHAMNPKEKSRSEGKRKSPFGSNFEGGSPLSMRESKITHKKPNRELMNSLSQFNSKPKAEIEKELLEEAQASGSKLSSMDEKNILE